MDIKGTNPGIRSRVGVLGGLVALDTSVNMTTPQHTDARTRAHTPPAIG